MDYLLCELSGLIFALVVKSKLRSSFELHMRRTKLQFESIQTGKAQLLGQMDLILFNLFFFLNFKLRLIYLCRQRHTMTLKPSLLNNLNMTSLSSTVRFTFFLLLWHSFTLYITFLKLCWTCMLVLFQTTMKAQVQPPLRISTRHRCHRSPRFLFSHQLTCE